MVAKANARYPYLIIGQGAAGMAAANELRELDGASTVTVITNEQDGFYSRIDLPDIISGKYHPTESMLQSSEQFRDKEIHCIYGERVTHIFPDEHSVELSSGQRLRYEKLLLATGSRPIIPNLAGVTAAQVYSLWTMAQAKAISTAAATAQAVVVIGAGLIGLKTALALNKRGLKTTVIERMDKVLPQQLDETGAAILAMRIRAEGVAVLTSLQVDSVETCGGSVVGVRIGTGVLPCDMVIASVGVRPDTTLPQDAGIAVGQGIVTDEFLQTSKLDIYAAGDVAEVLDVISGRPIVSAGWPAAVEQGAIAGRNMAGCCKEQYLGYLAKNSVEIAGMPLVSVGNANGDDGDEILTYHNGDAYKRLVIADNRLKGFLLMGDIRKAGILAGAAQRPAFSFADLSAF
ncbi:MAG TPA: FAD-dependent oxidoreductase [Negativicutes bacterium]|nr:FAD-dependent oxidoreductase [Negativicutes bacterium]